MGLRTMHRGHALWRAHLVHRVSGIALALFLPLHFWALGMVVTGAEQLDAFLTLAELPAVKALEAALVFLLAVHALGGLRLMAHEALGWTRGHVRMAASAFLVALVTAGAFLVRAI